MALHPRDGLIRQQHIIEQPGQRREPDTRIFCSVPSEATLVDLDLWSLTDFFHKCAMHSQPWRSRLERLTKDLKHQASRNALKSLISGSFAWVTFYAWRFETGIGPIFFKFTQRKGYEGFADSKLSALFKPIKNEQIENGILAAE